MARLDELKQKYSSVLKMLEGQGDIRVQNVHEKDNKLVIRAAVASDKIKNSIWDQIKRVDSKYPDISAEFNVDPSLAAKATPQSQTAPTTGKSSSGGMQSYTVQPGDSLSKIAKKFYGDAQAYMKIFEANRDQLKDPDMIHPGQVLKIPAAQEVGRH